MTSRLAERISCHQRWTWSQLLVGELSFVEFCACLLQANRLPVFFLTSFIVAKAYSYLQCTGQFFRAAASWGPWWTQSFVRIAGVAQRCLGYDSQVTFLSHQLFVQLVESCDVNAIDNLGFAPLEGGCVGRQRWSMQQILLTNCAQRCCTSLKQNIQRGVFCSSGKCLAKVVLLMNKTLQVICFTSPTGTNHWK